MDPMWFTKDIESMPEKLKEVVKQRGMQTDSDRVLATEYGGYIQIWGRLPKVGLGLVQDLWCRPPYSVLSLNSCQMSCK